MTVPQNRTQLLAAIETDFEKLIADLRVVPEPLWHVEDMEGHEKATHMSVADLVAYLIGWNELVIRWIERDAAGLPVDFPETGFKWNELGRLARKFYRDYEALNPAERLGRLEAAKEHIVALVTARDDAALYGRVWYGKWTMGRMIQFNTSSPYANARKRLRQFMKAKAIL